MASLLYDNKLIQFGATLLLITSLAINLDPSGGHTPRVSMSFILGPLPMVSGRLSPDHSYSVVGHKLCLWLTWFLMY